tara:strand:+ start:60 stop:386 length:327 start_codon:yes stop_codon:yes gene_type:complete
MKLKKLLKESNAWDRNFGEPLPTIEDTTRAYRLKQEDLNENKDLLKVATTLGKRPSDVNSFLKKHKLDADDLLDVIETGGRRYSLAIIAAMKGNRRALKQLDDLLGFL